MFFPSFLGFTLLLGAAMAGPISGFPEGSAYVVDERGPDVIKACDGFVCPATPEEQRKTAAGSPSQFPPAWKVHNSLGTALAWATKKWNNPHEFTKLDGYYIYHIDPKLHDWYKTDSRMMHKVKWRNIQRALFVRGEIVSPLASNKDYQEAEKPVERFGRRVKQCLGSLCGGGR